MGFDIVHYNLHKTFSQPHGGGGPGAGPVAVREDIEPFLPAPVVVRDGDRFRLDHDRPRSIGRVRGFAGPFGVFVRSYAFIRAYGPALRDMSEMAVLNANYLLARLKDAYELPYDRHCMHEFVLSARGLKREHGISALDVAKRLMDFDIHPPTIYFPLVVPEALMIEPTETETKERLDEFVDVMRQIAREAATDPQVLKDAPMTRPVRRLDEVKAAKEPVVKHDFGEVRAAVSTGSLAGALRLHSRSSWARRRGELAAGGGDVAATGEPHGYRHPRAFELRAKALDRVARGAVVRARGVVRDQVHLERIRAEQPSERARLRDRVVDAGEHHVLDEDPTASRRDVASALLEHRLDWVAIVDGHQLRAQPRVGRVEGQREPDRL